MAASRSDIRVALVRELLLPVRESLDHAGLSLAVRQSSHGRLTDWECFALTLCLAMREVVDIAIEDGDADERRNLRSILRVADDVIFAVRWTAEEWWPYVARTQNGRDTIDLVRHVESEIALGNMMGLDIYDGFGESVRSGESLMQAWALDQALQPCVGEAIRASI